MTNAPELGNERDIKDFTRALQSGLFEGQYYDWLAMDSAYRSAVLDGRMIVKLGKKQMTEQKSPEALTNERGATHGDWLQQSKMGFRLKEMMRKSRNWSTLEPHQAEALDMIATKMSRILTGDASEPDHWDDISGYAFLGKGGHAGK